MRDSGYYRWLMPGCLIFLWGASCGPVVTRWVPVSTHESEDLNARRYQTSLAVETTPVPGSPVLKVRLSRNLVRTYDVQVTEDKQVRGGVRFPEQIEVVETRVRTHQEERIEPQPAAGITLTCRYSYAAEQEEEDCVTDNKGQAVLDLTRVIRRARTSRNAESLSVSVVYDGDTGRAEAKHVLQRDEITAIFDSLE